MQLDSDLLVTVLLGAVALGGLYFGFLQPRLSGETRLEKRQKIMREAISRGPATSRNVDVAARRKQIKETLDEFEKRQKKARPTLQQRINQAGLSIEKTRFIVFSAIGGVFLALFSFVFSESPLYGLAGGFVGGVGLPFWILGFLRKRRLKAFSTVFPDALDAIVRGIKAGLPVGDTMRMIASEAKEPVRSEFRLMVEAQSAGMSVKDSVGRLAERVPTSEASFFSIVMSIQADSGGNLSEALGGLSKVLRDRAKLKLKINAMSSEAKSSAAIIGAMPVAVIGLIWFTTPDYISLLFTHPTGRVVVAISLCWMGMGILVMRKMINFDF